MPSVQAAVAVILVWLWAATAPFLAGAEYIPTEVDVMAQYQTYWNLRANGPAYTGCMPSQIGAYTELTELWFDRNSFTSTVRWAPPPTAHHRVVSKAR